MAMDEKLVERLIGCVPFDVEDSRTIQEAAQALTLAQARIRELETALSRQGDNMAFVVNNVGLPDQWREKFDRELTEDRQALKEVGE